MASVDWKAALKPLIEKYRGRKHPLDYGNTYQLLVMVLLSARDSDKHINQLAPALFARFPTMAELAKASFDELAPLIGSVSNFKTKAEWLTGIAQTLKSDEAIPLTIDGKSRRARLARPGPGVNLSRQGYLPAYQSPLPRMPDERGLRLQENASSVLKSRPRGCQGPSPRRR